MTNNLFHWNPDSLRQKSVDWTIDFVDALGDKTRVIAEIEESLFSKGESWLDYENVEWRGELNHLSERIRNLVLMETGVALLKCGPGVTPDQARLIQLLLGCRFGVNVTQTAQGDDRPLFALEGKDDPTANDTYLGNGLKRTRIGLHTDGSGSSDREVMLLSMLCIRPARFGGQSRVANSQLAFESLPQMARDILHESFVREDPYDPKRNPADLICRPIFKRIETNPSYLCFSYHPDFVRNGIRKSRGVLTRREEETFCLLETALEKFSCEINLMTNELLFLNNRVIAHDRRQFWDDPNAGRLLERFWAGTAAS